MQNDPSIPPYYRPLETLPNASTVLALGIIAGASLFFCCCVPIPVILGIMALVMGLNDRKLYRANPGKYSSASYDDLSLGIVLAIVSLVFFVLLSIIALILYGLQIVLYIWAHSRF